MRIKVFAKSCDLGLPTADKMWGLTESHRLRRKDKVLMHSVYMNWDNKSEFSSWGCVCVLIAGSSSTRETVRRVLHPRRDRRDRRGFDCPVSLHIMEGKSVLCLDDSPEQTDDRDWKEDRHRRRGAKIEHDDFRISAANQPACQSSLQSSRLRYSFILHVMS
ncbi:hypothetical protein E4T38_03236 [Aureobasidium subglaciale]|nr:hypothetical protein E4T38_03236 [Aureobasidium subglaciale]KAI5226445.1 hypothetical protein E4T40_03010 [Aureobasidium subglaciale]KAI5229905.1 hypothetical protein E4T41_03233 [Aureobasidium subglaciale]KAI5264456.1 hypothetical protein E4T46_03011 [Aureobasidium subglaciale]